MELEFPPLKLDKASSVGEVFDILGAHWITCCQFICNPRFRIERFPSRFVSPFFIPTRRWRVSDIPMDDDESTDIDSVSVQMERQEREDEFREDSIRTEDFSRKFNSTLIFNDGNPIRSCLYGPGKTTSILKDSALDSVRTEDFLTEFGKTIIKEVDNYTPYVTRSGGYSSAGNSKMRFGKTTFSASRPMEIDQDSIATENFESTFQKTIVRDDLAIDPPSTKLGTSFGKSMTLPASFNTQTSGRSQVHALPTYLHSQSRLSNISEGLECNRVRNRPTSPDRTEALLHDGPMVQSSARSSLSQIPFGLTPRQALDQKISQLDDLSSAVRTARSEKVRLISDLTRLEDSLRRNAAEFRLNEKMTRNSREQTEDARAELALAEMRRNRLLHSLETLNDKLSRKKEQLSELELALRERVREIQSLEEVGLTREEIDEVIRERDELFELIRASDETENAKYELEKKITVIRGEAAQEQQKASHRISALQEELEQSMTKISTFRLEKEALMTQVTELERQLDEARRAVILKDEEEHGLKSEIDHLKEDKESEVRTVSTRYQQELNRLHELKLSIESDLVSKNEELKRRVEELNGKIKEAEELNDHLCSENVQLKEKLTNTEEEVSERDLNLATVAEERQKVEEDLKSKMKSMEVETERKIRRLQEELTDKRLKDVENLRCRLESAHDTELRSTQDTFRQEIALLRDNIERKTEECDALTSLVQQKSREMELTQEEHQIEIRERIRDTLTKEHEAWQRKSDEQLKNDLTTLKEESNRVQESLKNKLERQREKTKQQENNLRIAREDMDRERHRLGSIIDDQSATISRLTRELEDTSVQYETRISEKERLLKSHLSAGDDLRSELDRQRHVLDELSQSERQVISTVYEECLRLVRGLHHGPISTERGLPPIPTEMKGCLQLLESCIKEAIGDVSQLHSRLEIEKRKLTEILATKNDTIKTLSDGKAKDMEDLKDKLIESHKLELKLVQESSSRTFEQLLLQKETELRQLRQNMQDWKTSTAEQLATKLQEEFNREYERKMRDAKKNLKRRERDLSEKQKEMDKLEVELTRARSKSPVRKTHSPDPLISTSTAARTISQLQERITALREENIGLRKENLTLRSSSPHPSDFRPTQDITIGFGMRNRTPTGTFDLDSKKTRSEASLPSMRSDRHNGSVDELSEKFKVNSRPPSRGSVRSSSAQFVPVRD